MSKKSFRLTDVNFARDPTCPHCGSLQNRRKFLHFTGELIQALGEREAGGKHEGRSSRTLAPSLARDSHFAPPYTCHRSIKERKKNYARSAGENFGKVSNFSAHKATK